MTVDGTTDTLGCYIVSFIGEKLDPEASIKPFPIVFKALDHKNHRKGLFEDILTQWSLFFFSLSPLSFSDAASYIYIYIYIYIYCM